MPSGVNVRRKVRKYQIDIIF